ncbi:hypothetical protein GGG16DRAFT_113824 [Schizophyllum commune]
MSISNAQPPDYSELPRYSTANLLSSAPPYSVCHSRPTTSGTAHASTSRPQLVEVRDGPLVLSIKAPRLSSRGRPKYLSGESVQGQITMELDHLETLHSVRIIVKGRIVSTHSEITSFTFLRTSHELLEGKQGHRRLVGQPQWAFDFPFPTEMQVERHGTYPLPQTFSDRGTAIAIHYELVAIVDHGKLRASRKVRTQLCYVPKTVAGAPSRARARAYRHGVPPPGPAEDPRGWCTLEPAVTRGRIFDKRDVEARYILSLASPLSYARGTVIPCHMTVQCFDQQALELLSSPKDLVVHLRRHVRYAFGDVKRESAVRPVIVCDVGKAIWWHSTHQHAHAYERRLDGEVHLPLDLQPSSDFPYFGVQYSVVVIPAPITGFKTQYTSPQVTQTVDITTWHAPGPIPQRTKPEEASTGSPDQRYIEGSDNSLIDSLIAVFSGTRRRVTVP